MTGIKKRLYVIIFESDTRAGKFFDLVLLILILLSVFLLILDSIPEIYDKYHETIITIEWILTTFFAIEYALRIYCASHRLKYIFSNYGIIDFIAITPSFLLYFFEGAGYSVIIRLIRIVRVFKVLNLKRFMDNGQVLIQSLIHSLYKITIFMMVVLIFVIIVGTLMYVVEGHENGFTSIPRSIYWTIVTVTTVGYGDITPKTDIGQIIAAIVMMMGYAIIAVPTGIVTVELSKKRSIEFNTPINCNNCSQIVYNNDIFCKHCGHRLKKESESSEKN